MIASSHLLDMVALADRLSTPLILVDRHSWCIDYLNASAHEWLDAQSGMLLTAVLPSLDKERIGNRLAKDRLAEHTHKRVQVSLI